MTAHSPNRISAVIPVHDGEAFVRDAVRSVLEQTHSDMECIVVDDGSTDGTADALAEFGADVVVHRQENRGVSVARNVGAELATGDVVAFLDADDVWLPEKSERQLELLSPDRAWCMVMCDLQMVDSELRPVRIARNRTGRDLVEEMLLRRAEVVSCSSTSLMRKEVFVRSGGFSTRLSTSADWGLLIHMAARGPIESVPEPLVLYRLHETNMSRDLARTEADMLRALDLALEDEVIGARYGNLRTVAAARLQRTVGASYLYAGSYGRGARSLLRSVRLSPTSAPGIMLAALRRARRRSRSGVDG